MEKTGSSGCVLTWKWLEGATYITPLASLSHHQHLGGSAHPAVASRAWEGKVASPAPPQMQWELPDALGYAPLASVTWLHMTQRQHLNLPGQALTAGIATAQGNISVGFQESSSSPWPCSLMQLPTRPWL